MNTSTPSPHTASGTISILLFCLLLCAATVGHCAAESKVHTASRKLLAAIPADLPPTYFLDKSGKPAGFAVDVMNELALKMSLTVEYVSGQSFDDVIQMVLTGKADLIPSLTIDEKRKELLAFTDPVGLLPANLFVASGNFAVQGISPGLKIGVMKGSAPETLLKKNQKVQLTIFTDLYAMLFELLAGHVDGIVFLTPNLMKLAIDAGVEDKIKVVGKPIIEAKRSIALRKGDTELLTSLNKAIGEFIISPKYRQIYVKWYGKPKSYWTVAKISVVSGILIALIAFGMAFWRYRSIVHLNNRLALSVAEYKQAAEALRGSETKLQAIFDAVGTGILIIDADSQIIIEANPTAIKMTGLAKEKIIGQICHSLVCPAQVGRCPVKDLGQRVDRAERKLILADGRQSDILKTVYPITIKDRKCYVESFIDITERKQAGEKLARLKQQSELILSSAAEGILGLDMQGKHIFVNPAAATMLGYEAEELLGRPSHSVWHHTKADGIPYLQEDCEIQAAFRKGTVHSSTCEIFWRKDGTCFPVEYASTPIYEEGRAVGAVVTFMDTADRKQAEAERRSMEERLQRAEKMEALGQLAGGVAHDLNNVLGVLSGYSELLLAEIPDGSRSRGHVEKILQSTEKGAAIIQDLLTLARRGVTASDVININSVVGGFLKAPVFEKTKNYHPRVTFRTEYDENLLNIKGSQVHLEKTLMNLVSNAAESIDGEGEVTIRTENRYLDKALRGYDEVKEGDYAVLTVSDTGMGISVENREKIFEPFYTKKKMGRSGTGLGLAIVWGTVKDHNGYIDLQTEVGEGTTFTLFFPVSHDELTAPQQKEPPEQYRGRGESVLVVDDIAEQRDVAAGLLTKLGYEVHLVSGGEEAVEYLKSNKADILVLDMIMAPGIDGLETFERILKVSPKQKAIIVSGFSETERVRKAQQLGAGAYVKKPYMMEKIGMAIRDELARK